MFTAPAKPGATHGPSSAWQMTMVAALIGALSLAMVLSAAAVSSLT